MPAGPARKTAVLQAFMMPVNGAKRKTDTCYENVCETEVIYLDRNRYKWIDLKIPYFMDENGKYISKKQQKITKTFALKTPVFSAKNA